MREPYAELVKYFGIYNPDLSLNIEGDWTLDEEYNIPVFITREKIAELLSKTMGIDSADEDSVLDLVWLNANLNFSGMNELGQEFMMGEINEDEHAWPSMREDLLRLAAFFRSGEFDYKAVQLKCGKGRTCEIQNYMGWFNRVFENQCFEKVFGKMTDTQIQEELDKIDERNKAARKRLEQEKRERRKKEKAIACGLSDLFMDKGLIKVPANVKLLSFLKEYLYEMEFIGEDEYEDPFFTETIRTWINGSRAKRPRLDTLPPPRPCSLEDLKPTEDDKQRMKLVELAFPISR